MQIPPPPASLHSLNPLRWLAIFGPGAIIASLTIGTGELIFSSRGGALFGYRILFLFLLISVLKWVMVFAMARHMVLSGIHPLQRWLELPGPRGWLPAVMFVFGVLCIPVWVSFHASVLGDLIAGVTETRHWLGGAGVHLWGAIILMVVAALSWAGGYAALETAQLVVVGFMLLVVTAALVTLQPDWWQMLVGALVPQPLEYPGWLSAAGAPARLQRLAETPVWVEASLYVGVIGGGGYDYLAYTSFLRDKGWGSAATPTCRAALNKLDPQARGQLRRWIRAPLIDCLISFAVVFAFSAVFVAAGHLVLAPREQIPGDGNFLDHQAQFLTELHPWLYPLYVAGTLLAMLGTLYGTLEVAPAVIRETARLVRGYRDTAAAQRRIRRVSLAWTVALALSVLAVSFWTQFTAGHSRPPGLTMLLIPANLFTGVLACGIICLLNPWLDRRLPGDLRARRLLQFANLAAAFVFLMIGIKGYWDFGGGAALGMLAATVAGGFVVAQGVRSRVLPSPPVETGG